MHRKVTLAKLPIPLEYYIINFVMQARVGIICLSKRYLYLLPAMLELNSLPGIKLLQFQGQKNEIDTFSHLSRPPSNTFPLTEVLSFLFK